MSLAKTHFLEREREQLLGGTNNVHITMCPQGSIQLISEISDVFAR